jgi:hypothetical protein
MNRREFLAALGASIPVTVEARPPAASPAGDPFSDRFYAEAGAARLQDSHAFTLRDVKRFNLTLDPFWPTSGAAVIRVAGWISALDRPL